MQWCKQKTDSKNKMEQDKEIILVDYALCSVYSDFIELNYKLTQDLRDKMLAHENRHSKSEKYTVDDFKNDFQSENSYFFESLKFALMFPECLIGFFPLMYSYYAKRFTWNTGALFPFLYFGLIFSFVLSLVFGFGIFINSFIFFAIMFGILNVALLILTHIIVRKNKGFIYKSLKTD